jgi:hypothetical protein
MPGRLFEIRYPNGDFEMDALTQQPPPEIGETLRRRGQLWRVVSKTFDEPFIVRVEPVPDRGNAAGPDHLALASVGSTWLLTTPRLRSRS